MEEENNKNLPILIPGEWAVKKVLGPTLDEIGTDFKKLYTAGRNKIVSLALRKIKNPEDGAKANLRVARDVFWNGAFTNEAICAEYFGGILSASRSQDGKDDSGVYYVDLIKSLSSAQLHLHYVIYRSLNKLLISSPDKKDLNVGMNTALSAVDVFFSGVELGIAGLKIDTDLEALYRKGLLNEYKTNTHELNESKKHFLYIKIVPTTLGIQLFAIANNEFKLWREYPIKDFPDFPNIILPKYCEFSIKKILEKANLK